MGLSLGAALLLGAILCPTDPVLAGDLGVGPPGDEDEHEPNFALTAEAGGNDGLAAPLVLLGVFVAEQGGTAGSASGWSPTCSTPAWPGWRSAPRSAGRRPGACTGCATASCSRPPSTATTRSPPRSSSTALAEVAGGYGFLAVFAGGLAFRRYERGHELNGRVHAGAEQVEKFMELAVILLLGSLLSSDGLGEPGWEGWLLAVVLLVVIRPLAVLLSLLGGERRDRRRAARSSPGSACAASARSTTPRPSSTARRRSPAARRRSWCGRRSRA